MSRGQRGSTRTKVIVVAAVAVVDVAFVALLVLHNPLPGGSDRSTASSRRTQTESPSVVTTTPARRSPATKSPATRSPATRSPATTSPSPSPSRSHAPVTKPPSPSSAAPRSPTPRSSPPGSPTPSSPVPSSSAPSPAPAPRLTILLATSFSSAGEPVPVKGRYVGADPGTTLLLERRTGDRWRAFPLPTVTRAGGRYSSVIQLVEPGRYDIRAHDPAADVVSDVVTLEIG